ncbi:MAG: MBL fold metallo-hydrolase, partial [Candidatus Aenigmarchaeota archaeon]|nr:MBL fold metallo-hydrolase [Candidatus Aenigmarchaeota archaeon]
IYTRNTQFFREGSNDIRRIVNTIKKRVELRVDPSLLLDAETAEEQIRSIVPKEADIGDIWFDEKRSIIIIEAMKPGVVIGKNGETIRKIREDTLWVPKVQRSPAIKSDLVRNIRKTLYTHSDYRRKFLHNIGERIYSGWERNNKYWIRLSCLGGFREVGRSCLFLQTPESKVMLDCGVNVASKLYAYPYLEAPEFNIKDLDAVIISHAHLDHGGFLPYLYKYGYKGPTYCTEPTRDVMTLLHLDYIDVAQKEGSKGIYDSRDVKKWIKHSVCLDYGEVTDVTPDVRLTLHNAGHVLGSSAIHLNIGDGYHNILDTGDHKFSRTKLLEPIESQFTRVETLITESTYGARDDIQPTREECEEQLLSIISDTTKMGGKTLIPVLGVGRAQED